MKRRAATYPERVASDTDTLRFVTPRGRLLVLAAVCAVITAMGAVIIALNIDNTPSLLLGVAVVGIFGLGGGFSLIGQFRNATVLRADADGIRVARMGAAPWADVDRIATAAKGELGIRMRRTEALLAGAHNSHTRESLRAQRERSGGYDLTFTAHDLGCPPADAARSLRALQP